MVTKKHHSDPYPKEDQIKRIHVSALRPGMFICDFNAGWLSHPFLKNQILITHQKQIKEIRQYGIEYVYIDIEKGKGSPEGKTLSAIASQDRPLMLDHAQEACASSASSPLKIENQPLTRENIKQVRSLLKLARARLRAAMEDIRLGRPIDVPAIRDTAEEITEATIRNGHIMSLICQLRKTSEYTLNHSLNVSILLSSFAQHLRFNPKSIKDIAFGGLLHDIGKLVVKDNILNKPGKLTEDEYEHMKSHVPLGLSLISPYKLPSDTIAVVSEHHERFDGSGYPNNLERIKISIPGRMAGIVDVYDAISSDRVYHRGLAPPEAIRRIFEWRLHFDPELVNCFVKCLGIYPVGSLVRLASNKLAVVIMHHPEDLLRPRVRVIYDINAQRILPRDEIELSAPFWHDRERIVGHEDAAAWGVAPLDILLQE